MKEAIEQLIEDYEKRVEVALDILEMVSLESYQYIRVNGKRIAYADIILELKGVLAQHETDNSNRANGNGADDRGDGQTNQVETIRPG